MKKVNRFIVFAAFALCVMPLRAQFLKNLGKKLKEKTEQVAKPATQQEDKSVTDKVAAPSGAANVKSQSKVMHATPDTKFINLPGAEKVSEMHGGMFGVVCNSYDWAFFNREGKMVFAPEWRNPTGRDADVCFDNGAVIMAEKSPSGRADKLFILYSDGTKKALHAHYTKPTQFVDGVARVLKRAPQQAGGTYVYINTAGKEVMPVANEKVKYGLGATDRVGKLSDGLRAHYWVGVEKWGYIDRNGKTVIQPAYEVARDFSEGRAVVATVKGYQVSYSVIDTLGKVIFTTMPTTVASDCHDGRIIVNDETNGVDNVYDRDGKLLKRYKHITPFYGGHAWALRMPEEVGSNESAEKMVAINADFEVVTHLSVTFLERRPDNFYGFTTGASGLATMGMNGHAYVFRPDGTIIMRSSEDGKIGSMTEDMAAQVDLSPYDNQLLGFVNTDGEFIVLFKTEYTKLASYKHRDADGKEVEVQIDWVTPSVQK